MTPSEKQFGRRVIFFIDDELFERLIHYSNKRGWKRSLVIREAIKSYLDKGEG